MDFVWAWSPYLVVPLDTLLRPQKSSGTMATRSLYRYLSTTVNAEILTKLLHKKWLGVNNYYNNYDDYRLYNIR